MGVASRILNGFGSNFVSRVRMTSSIQCISNFWNRYRIRGEMAKNSGQNGRLGAL